LIHELSVANGRILTPGGMNYRMLGLDPYSRHMSLPVLRAIYKLVAAGAVVAGPKPTDDPSLGDDQTEFSKLNNELFGDGSGVHTVGKGTVYAGQKLGDVFSALKVAPDFETTKPESDTRVLFAHRKLTDGDIYFVANPQQPRRDGGCHISRDGQGTRVYGLQRRVNRNPCRTPSPTDTPRSSSSGALGTVFVVFREPSKAESRTLPKVTETQLAAVEGAWNLSFTPNRGAPASIVLDKLISWPDHSDPGVEYFSGTGTYTKTIQASRDWFKSGAKLWIYLGDVKNLAEVTVNGKPLGIVWHMPFRVDATSALKPGANQLTVKVTNAWVNRMIGDEQPGTTTKYTFADVKPYDAKSPLLPSGLLGPVAVVREAAK